MRNHSSQGPPWLPAESSLPGRFPLLARFSLLAGVLLLALVFIATGCGDQQAPGLPEKAAAQMEKLEEEGRASFLEALHQQQSALQSTADIVARAETASDEDAQRAMTTLNSALLRCWREISSLRTGGAQEERELVRQLRAGNAKLQDAFNKLHEHHPALAPDLGTPEDEPGA